ncbi:DUF3096 domain-containing protein [Chloroflexota bacterium]
MGVLQISGLVGGILAIIAGIIIIVWPKIIAWIIGIYLIVMGALALWAALF